MAFLRDKQGRIGEEIDLPYFIHISLIATVYLQYFPSKTRYIHQTITFNQDVTFITHEQARISDRRSEPSLFIFFHLPLSAIIYLPNFHSKTRQRHQLITFNQTMAYKRDERGIIDKKIFLPPLLL